MNKLNVRQSLSIFIIFMMVFLAACSSDSGNKNTPAIDNENGQNGSSNEDKTDPENTTYPITIEVNDQTITIEQKPERILPLSLDVAEIVLELVEPSRVVAVSKAIDDPILSTHAEVAKQIESRIASAVNIDPEEILSYDTDLLLLTKLHGQEADAESILSQVNIPIITFNTMSTVQDLLDHIITIGSAVGEDEKATALVQQLNDKIDTIQSSIPDNAESPSVLVLSEVGPGTGPFMLGPTNISYDLIKLAKATPAIDAIELTHSTPASIEQVLKMDPDYIVLLDFVGNGEDAFNSLIDTPGWDTLQAIENERVKVLDVKYLMNPNVEVIDGLSILTNWIYESQESAS